MTKGIGKRKRGKTVRGGKEKGESKGKGINEIGGKGMEENEKKRIRK